MCYAGRFRAYFYLPLICTVRPMAKRFWTLPDFLILLVIEHKFFYCYLFSFVLYIYCRMTAVSQPIAYTTAAMGTINDQTSANDN